MRGVIFVATMAMPKPQTRNTKRIPLVRESPFRSTASIVGEKMKKSSVEINALGKRLGVRVKIRAALKITNRTRASVEHSLSLTPSSCREVIKANLGMAVSGAIQRTTHSLEV